MSFASVYREHHAFVWQTLRCLGVVDSALEDAVQDVFVVIHRRLDEFEGRAKLRTWIFEIVRRIAARYRSKATRDAARTFELPDLRCETDVEAAVERALALETLRAFLDRLDEDRVQVFMLAEFGQLPGREIAEHLGVNMNTVYARLRSARAELDRLATRLRAREAATLVATYRGAQPPAASRERTWSLLVVQLGLGEAAAAPIAAAPLKFLAAGAVLGIVVGAATLTAITPEPPPASATEARPAANPEPPAPPPAQPRPAATSASESAPPAAEPEAPAVTPAPAPEAPRLRPKRAAALPAVDAEPPSGQLAAEVAHVQKIRTAVELGQRARARTQIALYKRTYHRGALRPEVDALSAELRCTSEHQLDPQAAVTQFARKWPGSSLVDRLRRICRNGPQKTGRPETQPM